MPFRLPVAAHTTSTAPILLLAASLLALAAALLLSPPSLFSSSSDQPMATQKGSKTVADAIKDIELEKINGPSDSEFVKAGTFWEDQTAVIHILRRFGCRLCRANALKLQKIVPILEANNVRIVAVGIEKLGLEEFQQGSFWKGELYLDNGKKIHQALEIKSVGILGTVNMLMTNKDVKNALKDTKNVPGNLKGDGRQLGATFVLAKGGEMLMDFRQTNFADHPSIESIFEACGIDPALYKRESDSTDTLGVCDDVKCSI